MKRLLVFLLPLFALVLLSCDDDSGRVATGRFVYYVDGDQFHRQDIETGKDELLSTDRIVAFSGVASNGRVLYETRSGTWPWTYRLFGRCEGGQVISVPMPVAGDPAETFEYVHPERYGDVPVALAYGGHHAAFLAWQRPVAPADSLGWKLHLCVFDCAAWKMRTLDLGSVLGPHFAQQGLTMEGKPPMPDYVAISNDGGIAVVQVTLRVQAQGGEPVWKRVMLGGTLDNMIVLPTESAQPRFDAFAFEGSTGSLYAFTSLTEAVVFDCRGGSRTVATSRVPVSFVTLSTVSGEHASPWYTDTDIEFVLRRVADGRVHRIALNLQVLRATFPDTQWLVGSIEEEIALSPDGEWLAFRTSESEQHRALYVVRRDGTGLRRIAEGAFDVPPVVSDVVPY